MTGSLHTAKLWYWVGLSGIVTEWFTAYLKKVLQYVAAKNNFSRFLLFFAKRGVPQGSLPGSSIFHFFFLNNSSLWAYGLLAPNLYIFSC